LTFIEVAASPQGRTCWVFINFPGSTMWCCVKRRNKKGSDEEENREVIIGLFRMRLTVTVKVTIRWEC